MIETDETGQRKLNELLKHMDSSIFDDWEQRFLKEVRGKPYRDLSKHQKAVVTRLYAFFEGS